MFVIYWMDLWVFVCAECSLDVFSKDQLSIQERFFHPEQQMT